MSSCVWLFVVSPRFDLFLSSPLSWSSSSMWSEPPSIRTLAHTQNEEYCSVAIFYPLTCGVCGVCVWCVWWGCGRGRVCVGVCVGVGVCGCAGARACGCVGLWVCFLFFLYGRPFSKRSFPSHISRVLALKEKFQIHAQRVKSASHPNPIHCSLGGKRWANWKRENTTCKRQLSQVEPWFSVEVSRQFSTRID